jgi:F-type H+-transporting ATPase subunit b
MLGFDVPTFVFQIINFLILLAILARFFYRPVLDLMRRRQDEIDARIEDAEERARLADVEREKLARQSQSAEREAAKLLESARDDAAIERQRLLEAAKAEAASLIDEARNAATAEEQAALGRLGNRLSESAVKIAGALIRGSAGETVHESLVERLLTEGFGLDDAGREQAKLDFRNDASGVVVQSAYPLSSEQQAALRDQASKVLASPPHDLRIEVREDPDLIAGVRIVAGAVVIDMSVRHLLRELSRQEGAS